MTMVHGRYGPSLTFEALAERAETRLDGDQPIETRVSRLPNLTHAASAEGGKNLVRTKPRSRFQSHGQCPDYRMTGFRFSQMSFRYAERRRVATTRLSRRWNLVGKRELISARA
jgi:hypothetical protein